MIGPEVALIFLGVAAFNLMLLIGELMIPIHRSWKQIREEVLSNHHVRRSYERIKTRKDPWRFLADPTLFLAVLGRLIRRRSR